MNFVGFYWCNVTEAFCPSSEVIQNIQTGYSSQKAYGFANEAFKKIGGAIWDTPGTVLNTVHSFESPHFIMDSLFQNTVPLWFCIGVIGLVISGRLIASIIISKKNIKQLRYRI